MLTAILARFRNPDAWLDALPADGRSLDFRFDRALRRRAHLPDGRPEFRIADLLPWRRQPAEVIERIERPVSTLPPSQAVGLVVDALLGDARQRAGAEVDRHLDTIPRGP